MNCSEFSELLSEFFDGELTAEVAIQIQSHLSHCDDCASELRTFTAIRQMLTDNPDPPSVTVRNWDGIADRLEAHEHRHSNDGSYKSRRGFVLIAALALAASVVLLIDPWHLRRVGRSDHEHIDHIGVDTLAGGSVVDFEALFEAGSDSSSSQPALALQKLSDRFAGREIAAGESEKLLGFQPSITRGLPVGVQLVSNKVLKLPLCKCKAGQCTCGPGGCNCSASLCRRSDGSDFLVVEHCATQNISFGDLESKLVKYGENEFKLMEASSHWAATWLFGQRRLTAIGLASEDEAKSIISSIAMR